MIFLSTFQAAGACADDMLKMSQKCERSSSKLLNFMTILECIQISSNIPSFDLVKTGFEILAFSEIKTLLQLARKAMQGCQLDQPP